MRRAIFESLQREEQERENDRRCENCNHRYYENGNFYCELNEEKIDDWDFTCDDWY